MKIPWATLSVADFRIWWAERQDRLLGVAASLMLIAALVWLAYQFWRLLWQAEPWGAIDLRTLRELVQEWFAGRPVYHERSEAIQPPATYVILWPFLGWLAVAPARWLWAASTLAALAWLAYLIVRESGADTPLERTVAALMPFSMYATGAAIGNGQVIVHILPLLVAGLVLVRRQERPWRVDILAAALLLITFVKPSISVPFFWILLFVSNGLRPASYVALGYAALTFFALRFQQEDLTTLARSWLARSSVIAVEPGYGNVANLHVWLGAVGLEEWILPASMLLLMVLGSWIYCYRHVDLWLLLGVTAYVTRFWTYHRWYDDLLILLPMVALFRLAKLETNRRQTDLMAGTLLAITILTMLAPGGLFLFPPPWNTLYVTLQIFIWMFGLIFLVAQARVEKQWAID